MCMYDRIIFDNNEIATNARDKWKNGFVIIVFLFYFFCELIINSKYADNPGYDVKEDLPTSYKISKLLLNAILIGLGIWFIYKTYKICVCWRSRLARHKTFLSFTLYFVLTLYVLYLGRF